jgi:hypothetical protein
LHISAATSRTSVAETRDLSEMLSGEIDPGPPAVFWNA